MLSRFDFRNAMLTGGLLGLASAFAANNVLTANEQQFGYELLFNGADFSKWRSYQKTLPASAWTVVTEPEGTVMEVTKPQGNAHIFTRDSSYQNFDLMIEWKVPVAGNSGISIRYIEANGYWAGHSGPEAQVVDIAHSDGQKPLHRAGTDYDMFPLNPGTESWFGPTGTWNQFRIIVFNKKVAHFGNGVKLLEYEMLSPEWEKAYAGSKYDNSPDYRTVHPGAIYLQHHGEVGIRYRNIRIKKLSDAQNPWGPKSVLLNAAGTGLVDKLTYATLADAHPTRIGAPPRPSTSGSGMEFLRTGDGYSLFFPKQGDYTLRVTDLRGATAFTERVRNADRYDLRAPGFPLGGKILSVSSAGKIIQQSRLP